jgi:hypothetical protein
MSRRMLSIEALETRQLMAVDAFDLGQFIGSGQGTNPAAGNVDYFLKAGTLTRPGINTAAGGAAQIDPNDPNQPNPAGAMVDFFLKLDSDADFPGPHVRPAINTAHPGGANIDPSNPNGGDPAAAHVDFFFPHPGYDQGAATGLSGATPKNTLIGLL